MRKAMHHFYLNIYGFQWWSRKSMIRLNLIAESVHEQGKMIDMKLCTGLLIGQRWGRNLQGQSLIQTIPDEKDFWNMPLNSGESGSVEVSQSVVTFGERSEQSIYKPRSSFFSSEGLMLVQFSIYVYSIKVTSGSEDSTLLLKDILHQVRRWGKWTAWLWSQGLVDDVRIDIERLSYNSSFLASLVLSPRDWSWKERFQGIWACQGRL